VLEVSGGKREWAEEEIRVGDTSLHLIRGGSGRPLLTLHGELGHPGWLSWNSALARDHTLLAPLHPGFGVTAHTGWVRNIRDLACFYARFLREQKLAPIDVIGFSLGGWIAAEMAANDPSQFRRVVLVGAAGIRPPQGDIMDMFVVSARKYVAAGVLNPSATLEFEKLYGGDERTVEQFEAWEEARAETARLAWQPYLYNPSLPSLLEGIAGMPTLLIWGRQDPIVPLSAAQVYRSAIAGSRLVVFEDCGHRPEIEKTSGFIREVSAFLS